MHKTRNTISLYETLFDDPTPVAGRRIDWTVAAAAVSDLARWAFDVALDEVNDWPQAQLRIRRVRRAVLARLEGGWGRRVATEDALFAAELLASLLAEQFDLDYAAIASVLDALELPTVEVPVVPRTRCVTTPARPSVRFCADSMRRALVPLDSTSVFRTAAGELDPLAYLDDAADDIPPEDLAALIRSAA